LLLNDVVLLKFPGPENIKRPRLIEAAPSRIFY